MDRDERLREMNEMMDDFFTGAQVLQRLAGWAYVVANHQEVLTRISLFEKAYEQMLELHTLGKLDAGAAKFSAEGLETVRRIGHLIQSNFDSSAAQGSAQEIYTLAEQCLGALKAGNASLRGQ